MTPVLMSNHTDPNLPLSPVVVKTSKPSMACANNIWSRKGYARLTNSVAIFPPDALVLIDNSKSGIMPILVGKTKNEAVASTLFDMTERKILIYVNIAKNRKP